MDVIVHSEKDCLPAGSKDLGQPANYQQNILLRLGYEPAHLPLANLLKAYHDLDGKWLIASPVHWEATHNDAMLIAAGKTLELTDAESRLWFAEVADFLKADGFTPVYHDAHHWLFRVDDKPEIKSQAVETLVHQSLMPIFSGLDSSLFWQRLITELQMYLSANPLNEKRQGPPLNGLWFWGEGDFNLNGLRDLVSDDEVLLRDQTVKRLTPESVFAKDDLLVINDPKQIERCDLEKKLKNKTVNWYWSNCSYRCKANHWWSRIWR